MPTLFSLPHSIPPPPCLFQIIHRAIIGEVPPRGLSSCSLSLLKDTNFKEYLFSSNIQWNPCLFHKNKYNMQEKFLLTVLPKSSKIDIFVKDFMEYYIVNSQKNIGVCSVFLETEPAEQCSCYRLISIVGITSVTTCLNTKLRNL